MKELLLILSFTWKFAFTIPIAIGLQMSFVETIVYANIGGILGVLIFAFLSKGIIELWDRIMPERWRRTKADKKLFTKKTRRFVLIKSKYGLPGIVILTPVILSIPVGVFLIVKYYGKSFLNYIWLVLGLFIWSLIYALFYFQCKDWLCQAGIFC